MIGAAVTTEPIEERLEFLRQIDRFVKSPYRYFPYGGAPVFSKLNREQCRFYAYFRTQIDTLENIKGDEGYYRLLVIECLSTEEGRARLERYLSEDRGPGFYVFAKGLLPELRMHRGEDPGDDLGLLWDNKDLLYTQTFLPGYTGASYEQLSSILSILGFGYVRRISSNAGIRLYGRALRLVENHYKRSTGRGMGETFAGERVCMFRRAFAEYLPPEECSRHAICYRAFDERMNTLLREIADCVDMHPSLCRGDRRPYESRRTILSDELAEAIAGMDANQTEMEEEHGRYVTVLTAGSDGRMPEGCPPPQYTMIYSGELTPRDIDISGTSFFLPDSDISGNDGPYYPEPLERLPDGRLRGLEYYRFWRDSLQGGRLFPADTAMIMTLYADMTRNGASNEDVYHAVMMAVRPMKRVPEALVRLTEYLTVRGDMPVDRSLARVSREMLKHLICRIMSGRRQPVAKWLFTECLDLEIEFDSPLAWDVFRVAFAKVMRILYRGGTQWFADNNVSIVRIPCGFVPDGGKPVEFDAISYIRHQFSVDARYLYAEVVARLRNNRRRSIELFGMYVSPVIDYAIGAVERGRAVKAQKPVIDMTKVRQAREDLDYVVSAVGVDEPDEVTDIEESSPSPEGDPWKTFIDSLSASEREYLAAAISGTHADMLLESSINDRAAEITGDSVVEDGKVFEEYITEIRSRIS